MITKLLEKDQRQRGKLALFFDKVVEFVGELPETISADFRTAFPDLDEELTAGKQNLTVDKCAILVAGKWVKYNFVLSKLNLVKHDFRMMSSDK